MVSVDTLAIAQVILSVTILKSENVARMDATLNFEEPLPLGGVRGGLSL